MRRSTGFRRQSNDDVDHRPDHSPWSQDNRVPLDRTGGRSDREFPRQQRNMSPRPINSEYRDMVVSHNATHNESSQICRFPETSHDFDARTEQVSPPRRFRGRNSPTRFAGYGDRDLRRSSEQYQRRSSEHINERSQQLFPVEEKNNYRHREQREETQTHHHHQLASLFGVENRSGRNEHGRRFSDGRNYAFRSSSPLLSWRATDEDRRISNDRPMRFEDGADTIMLPHQDTSYKSDSRMYLSYPESDNHRKFAEPFMRHDTHDQRFGDREKHHDDRNVVLDPSSYRQLPMQWSGCGQRDEAFTSDRLTRTGMRNAGHFTQPVSITPPAQSLLRSESRRSRSWSGGSRIQQDCSRSRFEHKRLLVSKRRHSRSRSGHVRSPKSKLLRSRSRSTHTGSTASKLSHSRSSRSRSGHTRSSGSRRQHARSPRSRSGHARPLATKLLRSRSLRSRSGHARSPRSRPLHSRSPALEPAHFTSPRSGSGHARSPASRPLCSGLPMSRAGRPHASVSSSKPIQSRLPVSRPTHSRSSSSQSGSTRSTSQSTNSTGSQSGHSRSPAPKGSSRSLSAQSSSPSYGSRYPAAHHKKVKSGPTVSGGPVTKRRKSSDLRDLKKLDKIVKKVQHRQSVGDAHESTESPLSDADRRRQVKSINHRQDMKLTNWSEDQKVKNMGTYDMTMNESSRDSNESFFKTSREVIPKTKTSVNKPLHGSTRPVSPVSRRKPPGQSASPKRKPPDQLASSRRKPPEQLASPRRKPPGQSAFHDDRKRPRNKDSECYQDDRDSASRNKPADDTRSVCLPVRRDGSLITDTSDQNSACNDNKLVFDLAPEEIKIEITGKTTKIGAPQGRVVKVLHVDQNSVCANVVSRPVVEKTLNTFVTEDDFDAEFDEVEREGDDARQITSQMSQAIQRDHVSSQRAVDSSRDMPCDLNAAAYRGTGNDRKQSRHMNEGLREGGQGEEMCAPSQTHHSCTTQDSMTRGNKGISTMKDHRIGSMSYRNDKNELRRSRDNITMSHRDGALAQTRDSAPTQQISFGDQIPRGDQMSGVDSSAALVSSRSDRDERFQQRTRLADVPSTSSTVPGLVYRADIDERLMTAWKKDILEEISTTKTDDNHDMHRTQDQPTSSTGVTTESMKERSRVKMKSAEGDEVRSRMKAEKTAERLKRNAAKAQKYKEKVEKLATKLQKKLKKKKTKKEDGDNNEHVKTSQATGGVDGKGVDVDNVSTSVKKQKSESVGENKNKEPSLGLKSRLQVEQNEQAVFRKSTSQAEANEPVMLQKKVSKPVAKAEIEEYSEKKKKIGKNIGTTTDKTNANMTNNNAGKTEVAGSSIDGERSVEVVKKVNDRVYRNSKEDKVEEVMVEREVAAGEREDEEEGMFLSVHVDEFDDTLSIASDVRTQRARSEPVDDDDDDDDDDEEEEEEDDGHDVRHRYDKRRITRDTCNTSTTKKKPKDHENKELSRSSQPIKSLLSLSPCIGDQSSSTTPANTLKTEDPVQPTQSRVAMKRRRRSASPPFRPPNRRQFARGRNAAILSFFHVPPSLQGRARPSLPSNSFRCRPPPLFAHSFSSRDRQPPTSFYSSFAKGRRLSSSPPRFHPTGRHPDTSRPSEFPGSWDSPIASRDGPGRGLDGPIRGRDAPGRGRDAPGRGGGRGRGSFHPGPPRSLNFKLSAMPGRRHRGPFESRRY